MRLEQINLKLVESNEGFLEILDLESVEEVMIINDAMRFGTIRLKNGLMKYLTPEATRDVRRCLEKR